ncbi:MAG: AraC family transcriptional regulator [Clostridia bacterium]|nr:AraC family transcriptional regulator [Clostridia bacterium]
MQKTNEPFSFYFPVALGHLGLTVYLDENLHATGEHTPSGPHSHHIFELRYAERGEIFVTVEGDELSLPEGHLLLTHPGEYHYVSPRTARDSAQYTLRFGLEEPGESASAQKKRAYGAMRDILAAARLTRDGDGIILDTLRAIDREIAKKRSGYVGALQHLAALLLTEFVRLRPSGAEAVFPPDDLKYQGLLLTRLEQFFSWRHSERDVKIDALARDVGLSARHTARILREAYGLSFSEKLAEVRVQRAKYQLESTELSCEKISELVGFANSSYFYMCFKKIEGITPSQYREKIRGRVKNA